jgi:hypothetical protein
VIIDKPIETEGLGTSDTGELRDQVREVIAARVASMGREIAAD